MEKNSQVIEPNFEGEEMRLPTNRASIPVPETKTSTFLTAPIIILLVLILITILGGFYYWYTIVMSEQVSIQNNVRPTPEQNDEPESTTAEARTGLMDIVSTSDELEAIAADAESTHLEDLTNEIAPIETDLEAALQAGQ